MSYPRFEVRRWPLTAPDFVSVPEDHVHPSVLEIRACPIADPRQVCVYHFAGPRETDLEVLILPCLVWVDPYDPRVAPKSRLMARLEIVVAPLASFVPSET